MQFVVRNVTQLVNVKAAQPLCEAAQQASAHSVALAACTFHRFPPFRFIGCMNDPKEQFSAVQQWDKAIKANTATKEELQVLAICVLFRLLRQQNCKTIRQFLFGIYSRHCPCLPPCAGAPHIPSIAR